jgi:hypothetical protein
MELVEIGLLLNYLIQHPVHIANLNPLIEKGSWKEHLLDSIIIEDYVEIMNY